MGVPEGLRLCQARRSVSARLAILVVAVAVASGACLAPAPGGLRNGFLPDSVLQTINSHCRIWNPAAPSLLWMMASATVDGVDLQPESCYRSYAEQVAVRNYWCSLGLCQFAAVPGTSTHGWGKAVDFADQTGELTFTSPGYLWLQAHAYLFCFHHPPFAEPGGVAPEPWHWEWNCG
jgi:hypothetical protein